MARAQLVPGWSWQLSSGEGTQWAAQGIRSRSWGNNLTGRTPFLHPPTTTPGEEAGALPPFLPPPSPGMAQTPPRGVKGAQGRVYAQSPGFRGDTDLNPGGPQVPPTPSGSKAELITCPQCPSELRTRTHLPGARETWLQPLASLPPTCQLQDAPADGLDPQSPAPQRPPHLWKRCSFQSAGLRVAPRAPQPQAAPTCCPSRPPRPAQPGSATSPSRRAPALRHRPWSLRPSEPPGSLTPPPTPCLLSFRPWLGLRLRSPWKAPPCPQALASHLGAPWGKAAGRRPVCQPASPVGRSPGRCRCPGSTSRLASARPPRRSWCTDGGETAWPKPRWHGRGSGHRSKPPTRSLPGG